MTFCKRKKKKKTAGAKYTHTKIAFQSILDAEISIRNNGSIHKHPEFFTYTDVFWRTQNNS